MGLSKKQLAQLIKVSKHSLSDWETGKAKPRSSSVRILTEWLKHTDFDGPNKDFARSALGKRIATKRREQGMNQKQLSQFLGVRERTLNKWEIGAAFPRRTKLKRLMQLLSDDSFEKVAEHAKFVKLGQDIKERGKRLDLTQPKLAERLGVSTKTVVVWELGGKPTMAKLEDIADWLAEPMPAKSGLDEVKDVVRRKKKRQSLGWSQARLTRHLGVGKNRVYEWEKGIRRPGPDSLKKMMRWLSEDV